MLQNLENNEDFEREFCDEDSCFKYLLKVRYKGGTFLCSQCNSEGWLVRRYTYECSKCHHQESILSGTLFQDTHKPLRLWFRAIWFITWYIKKNKRTVALEMMRKLDIKSYKTAWAWLHKLRRIMVNPNEDMLSGRIEIYRKKIDVLRKGGKEKDDSIFIVLAMEIKLTNNKEDTCRYTYKRLARQFRPVL
ncbi:MAG: transposase [Clostridiales bacterium]|jgi:hypothetical protein|nr:transposase [Clostridiales bacterium]